MCEIYKIECLANGRFYIGSAGRMTVRKGHHLYLLRKGKHRSTHLQRSYEKYGESSLVFSVLETDISLKDLIKKETQYIRKLKPEFNADMPHATRRGSHQSNSCKAKVSAANKGRKHTASAKKKISSSLLGNKRSEGNQNALKVTKKVKKKIDSLKSRGLGCRKIAALINLDKTTVLNVFNNKHNYRS